MVNEEITVVILAGLRTAECTESNTPEHIGKNFNVANPYFKCEELFGLYPGRKYKAEIFPNTDVITLTKTIEPFPR